MRKGGGGSCFNLLASELKKAKQNQALRGDAENRARERSRVSARTEAGEIFLDRTVADPGKTLRREGASRLLSFNGKGYTVLDLRSARHPMAPLNALL